MSKYNTQYYAGRLLGFYEAGDAIMQWVNSLDISEMSVKDFRKQLNTFIMDIRPEIKVGRTTATRTEKNPLRTVR